MHPAEAAQELIKREDARNDMRAFGDYMRPTMELDFKFSPAAHHLIMIDALTKLIEGTEYQRLLVMVPPGAAKSTYCSIQFACWYLAKFPDDNILCASNTETLAETFNRRRRNICLTDEWQAVAGSMIASDKQGVAKFETVEGGGSLAAGVGSGIVGFRSNLNILDDPVLNFEQSLSNNAMDKQWEWYQADFRSRLVPTGKELVVTTRWTRRDIPGRILELIASGDEKGWKILRMPMECDDNNDLLGRDYGDRLWPEWFTEKMVEENKRDPRRWLGMYQQIPMDEKGSWVGAEELQIVDRAPEKLNYVCAVDIALSIKGGDWTVFVVVGISENRDIYVLDIDRRQTDPDQTCETFFKIEEMYAPTQWLIDDDNTSRVFSRLLLEKCRARGKNMYLDMIPTKGQDKEIRAGAIRGFFKNRRVYILKGAWNNLLISEMMSFPTGDHDDQIDCLSLIGRQMPALPGPTGEGYKSNPELKFFLQKDREGNTQTTIGLDEMFKDRGQGILSVARRRI